MSKKAFVIVGLGYGDEGKGMTTDIFCCHTSKPIVIRFNGGHQAGHTVITKSKGRHVFSSFGSGTLRGVPTYWSRYCTISPSYLLYEMEDFKEQPSLYIDSHCPVTTHYDVLFNRLIEKSRGVNKLGSCGVGYGATFDRHIKDKITLFAKDLINPSLVKKKLKFIRKYYEDKFERETYFSFNQFNHDKEDILFLDNTETINLLLREGQFQLTNEEMVFKSNSWNSYVFEGAQGILLDKTFGNKPYITKSNTTSRNAFDILKRNFKIKDLDVEIIYVSRTYLTRHGEGPFLEFENHFVLKGLENETNIFNEHQGRFKKGYLRKELLNYSLECDLTFSKGIKKSLLITCMDQLYGDEVPFYEKNELKQIHFSSFTTLLNTNFYKQYFSFSSCTDDFEFDI